MSQKKPLLSPKQREFWRNCNHRWNIKSGAVRSGKSYMDYYLIPKRIRDGKGKEGLNVILGNTRGTIKRNIIMPMQMMYGENRVSDIKSDNTCTMFGETVYCLGADKINMVDRLRGSSIKYCYGDEIVTWHQDVFEMLKSRLDKFYSRFDGACNPDGPMHWFYDFLQSDADIYLQNYTIYDNPFLDPEFVENLKKEYAGTVLYDRYINGLWVAAEGALFTTYPQYTDDTTLFRDGYAHIDAAYGGSDGTAFTCGKRVGDTIFLYGKLWQKHVDLVLDTCIREAKRLMCAPILCETNADKGYLAKEIIRRGYSARTYTESMNKFLKISTYLRKWWGNVVFLEGTDKSYIAQIMSYTETAEHDDACLDGDTQIATLFGYKAIKDIKAGEHVITPSGVKRVLFSGVTGEKEVFDCNGVLATDDHKFFDASTGNFVQAKQFDGKCSRLSFRELVRWKKRLLCSTEKPISEIRRADITLSTQQEIAKESMQCSCTGLCGSTTTEKFRKGITYIILMAMSIITTLPIWSAFLLGNICQSTAKRIGIILSTIKKTLSRWMPFVKKQKNGMQAKREKRGTENMLKRLFAKFSKIRSGRNASSAEKNSMECRGQCTAGSFAKEKRTTGESTYCWQNKEKNVCTAEKNMCRNKQSKGSAVLSAKGSNIGEKKRLVYNLTVENAGCYYANNVLVSNCDSAASLVRIFDRRGAETEYKSPFGG